MDTKDKNLEKFDKFFDAVGEKDIVLKHSVTIEWLERVENVQDKLLKDGSDASMKKNSEFLKAQHDNCQTEVKDFIAVIEAKGMVSTTASHEVGPFDKAQEKINALMDLMMNDYDREDLPPCLKEMLNSPEAQKIRELIEGKGKPSIQVVRMSDLLKR